VQMDMGSTNLMNAFFSGSAQSGTEGALRGNPDVSDDDSSDTD
jgi:hypothetical protein